MGRQIWDASGKTTASLGAPLFWGYCLPPGSVEAAHRALREWRLAVVASLENDGPLLQSYTLKELEAEIEKAQQTRWGGLRYKYDVR